MEIRWCLLVDIPTPKFDRALEFWSAVTGWPAGGPIGDHEEFVPLDPAGGDPYLLCQRLGRATGVRFT